MLFSTAHILHAHINLSPIGYLRPKRLKKKLCRVYKHRIELEKKKKKECTTQLKKESWDPYLDKKKQANSFK